MWYVAALPWGDPVVGTHSQSTTGGDVSPEQLGIVGQGVQLLLSLLGVAALLREALKLGFQSRKDRREELAAFRAEQRLEIKGLKEEGKARGDRVDQLQREYFTLLGQVSALTSENHALRAENHSLRNYVTVLFTQMQVAFRRAGLPTDNLPPIPEWLFESVSGPTAAHAVAPVEEKPHAQPELSSDL